MRYAGLYWVGAVGLAGILVACGGGGSSTPASTAITPPVVSTSPGTSAAPPVSPSTTTNQAPIAHAGSAQTVEVGRVYLSGSASSDADGDALTYLWTLTSKPAGSTATLVALSAVSPSFTADVAGTYVVTLVVNDGKVSSNLATVTITAQASVTSATAWQAQSLNKTWTPLSVSSDDTVNPLRGYHRWRGQERVPQTSSALDAYQRYAWRDLEPTQGNYNFSTILADLATAKAQGRKFALRLRMMLGYDDGEVYVPAYLVGHASCAHGCGWWADYDAGNPLNTFVPDWNDTFLQQRASLLLQALATALGTQADIAWIDIGLYGQWGEWALSSSINYATAPLGVVAATDAAKRAFVDMHLNAFSNRQLVMFALYGNYDAVRYATTQQAITQLPVGLRIDCLGRDGFMDQWLSHAAEWAVIQNVWKTAPFVAEYCGFTHLSAGHSAATALQQVRDFHISSIGNANFGTYTDYSASEQTAFLQVGREGGYRYRPDTASITLDGSGLLTVSAVVRNEGNAPTYEPWDVLLELNNSAASTVWSQTLSGSLKTSQGASSSQTFGASVQLPTLTAGDYTLRLIARDGRRLSATPVRAPLRWTVLERGSDGGVDLATLHKN